MRAICRFQLSDGATSELGHGDIIGRLSSAALWLDDPHVSEAHAMVSLRGGKLQLLALRGRFSVDGKVVERVTLRRDLRIKLARGVELLVEEVQLPSEVMGIEADGLPRQILTGLVSVMTDPQPSLRARFAGDAAAWIWSDGVDWRIRIGQQPSTPLQVGDNHNVNGLVLRAVKVVVTEQSDGITLVRSGLHSGLKVVAHFATVHIHRNEQIAVSLTGKSAQVVSELVAFDGPVHWSVLAKELWGPEIDPTALRRRLDVCIARLRRTLRDAGIRPDLVRATGTGHFELLLHPRDEVVDQT